MREPIESGISKVLTEIDLRIAMETIVRKRPRESQSREFIVRRPPPVLSGRIVGYDRHMLSNSHIFQKCFRDKSKNRNYSGSDLPPRNGSVARYETRAIYPRNTVTGNDWKVGRELVFQFDSDPASGWLVPSETKLYCKFRVKTAVGDVIPSSHHMRYDLLRVHCMECLTAHAIQ